MKTKAHRKQKHQSQKDKPTSARTHSLAPADLDETKSMTMAEREEQAELAGIKEGAVTELPKQVQNGMILATMLKPDFEEGKDDKRFIGVALSFQLTAEHEDMLPDQVAHAWEFVKQGGTKRVDIVDITPQSLEVGFASDTKVEIEIPWNDIRKASISVVEETGKGETQEVIRFKFVAFSEIESSVVRFCSKYFGKAVWIKLEKSQVEIPLEDEE
jgi:hypothetical protein